MKLVHWMNSPTGRLVRGGAGLALIALGLTVSGTGGLALAVVGLVPLAAGVLGICLIAPLLRISPREH
jgi:hypothetical protein